MLLIIKLFVVKTILTMIDFDTLSSYKAQRPYKGHIIYYEFEGDQGTWSVWSTTEFDEENQPNPILVYGGGDRPLMVRNEVLESGFYSTRAEGTIAAKQVIDNLLETEEIFSIAA